MSSAERPLKVIVVAYGRAALLQECLRCLNAPFDAVVVVDNSLDDEVRELAVAAEATYLRPFGNIGFAAGVNLALQHLHGGAENDVLLLNPDACISWEQVRQLQLALHTVERCGAVSPLLRSAAGHPERVVWPVPGPAAVWLDAFGLSRLYRGARFLSGAVLLLRAEAVADVGTFDERFFLYAEEADWQVRLARAGWTCHVVEEVTATHAGGGTSSDPDLRNALFDTSAILFARKWQGRLGFALVRTGACVAAVRRLLTGTAQGRRAARASLRRWLAAAAPPPSPSP